MKKKVLFIFIITFSLKNYSQNDINLGIRGGVNISGFHTNDAARTSIIGYNIGGIAEYKLNNSFSLYSELSFNRRGGSYFVDNNNQRILNIDYKLDYLDIPIQLKYYFLSTVSFDIGVQMGLLINSQEKFFNQSGDEVSAFEDYEKANSFDSSVNAGFSFRLNPDLFLQTRYNFGLTKVFDSRNFKNSMISFSLAYFFK